eukprot:GHVP01069841.1.p1 GENE.GHVP01069841.1~~GHVP01069841.1.p1  ORF type:complete len:891 (+),score=161.88 GHVP01069841.1:22-2673(+)
MARQSALFTAFRSLGKVTDSSPFAIAYSQNYAQVVVGLGNYFNILDCPSLKSLLMSPCMESPITCTACHKRLIFVGHQNETMSIWNRLEKVGLYHVDGIPKLFLNIGATSICLTDKAIQVIQTGCKPKRLRIEDTPTAVCHPETCLDKIVIGTFKGQLEIWDYSTRNCVKKLTCLIFNSTPISALSICSSSWNTLFVGTEDGKIFIVDIEDDELLDKFEHAPEDGGITSLTYAAWGLSMLASTTENGLIALWDLENQTLSSMVETAHLGRIVKAEFIKNEPLLLTSGDDNSLVCWQIHPKEKTCIELRARKGIPGPISKVAYYDDESKDIIASGNFSKQGSVGRISRHISDKVLLFSDRHQDIGPLVDISWCFAKHFDWPAVISCHEGSSDVHIWSGHGRVLTKKNLTLQPSNRQSAPKIARRMVMPEATAVCVSPCGNFGFVGYYSGEIHRFNLQSTIHSGELLFNKGGVSQAAHGSPVKQILVSSPTTIVTACAQQIRVWDYHAKKVLCSYFVGDDDESEVMKLAAYGSLVAIGQMDGSVILLDVVTKKTVRWYEVGSEVTALEFHSDGKRILIASKSDCALRVYDILSNVLVDWLVFDTHITAMAMRTDLLLCLADRQGRVDVWVDNNLLGDSFSVTKAVDQPFKFSDFVAFSHIPSSDKQDENLHGSELIPVAPGLITLSGLPPDLLGSILAHEEIRSRTVPVKKVESVETPFFLPTKFAGTLVNFAAPEPIEAEEDHSRLKKSAADPKAEEHLSNFQRLLRKKDHEATLRALQTMSPAGINLVFAELGDMAGSGSQEILLVLKFFDHFIQEKTHSDFIQTLLLLFLESHSEELRKMGKKGVSCLQRIQNTTEINWKNIDTQFQRSIFYLKFLTQLQVV